MKDYRKDFKKIVEQLKSQNILERLQQPTVTEVQTAWSKIISEYKMPCSNWMKKHKKTTYSDWIYPRNKKLKIKDNPIEICILIKLMNEVSSEDMYDSDVLGDEQNLCDALRKTNEVAAIKLAAEIETNTTIQNMSREQFCQIFVKK